MTQEQPVRRETLENNLKLDSHSNTGSLQAAPPFTAPAFSRNKVMMSLCLFVSVLYLAGCSNMAPKYSRPGAPVAAAWPDGPAYKDVAAKPGDKAAADIPWQEFFTDPQLAKLTALALENNRDLRVATLNIERSRALYGIQRSDLFPKVDASAGSNFQRIPADLSGTGRSETVQQHSIGLGVSSYELDLFGRVRSLKD